MHHQLKHTLKHTLKDQFLFAQSHLPNLQHTFVIESLMLVVQMLKIQSQVKLKRLEQRLERQLEKTEAKTAKT